MASYRGHLMLAAPLGAAYGAVALMRPEFDWGTIVLGATLTAVGGVLPDLDSDSGVPVRELFGIISAILAVFLYHPIKEAGFTIEQTLALLILAYFFMRYVVSAIFKRCTVHRGMFHSIPAMLVAGLIVYLSYPSSNVLLKGYLGIAMALGYLSHLVLDEIYSIDFNGTALKLNSFSGTAVKFGSDSWMATLFTYTILGGLVYLTVNEVPPWAKNPMGWFAAIKLPH